MTAISVNGLTLRYGITTILKDIDTTTIPLILVPAQIINIGASAVFGNAFKTIK